MGKRENKVGASRVKKIITCAVPAVILIALLYKAYVYHNTVVKSMACFSHVSSLHACLTFEFSKRKDIFSDYSKNWKQLTAAQYGRLGKILSEGYYSIDTGGKKIDSKNILFDHWGRPIIIGCREKDDGLLEFIVCSSGPDKILRTKDDINAPGDLSLPESFEKVRAME
jgi:hypothetical protein